MTSPTTPGASSKSGSASSLSRTPCAGAICVAARFRLGDFRGAYRHLRAYAEITPRNAWSWCWLGRACIALGELGEARTVLTTALEIETAGGDETDARELLAELDGRDVRSG